MARRGLALPLTARALKQQLERLRIDVLVVTQNKDLALATLAKQLMRGALRIVYQQHMQLGRPKRSLIHRLRFRQIDAWLTPLPGLGEEVLRWTPFDKHRLHMVPLGLPMEQFSPPARTRSEARQELGLPLQGLLLGILGRFDKGKGQDFVIEALHQLRREHGHDADLLVMGEPTRNECAAYYQQLRQQVVRLGLQEQVHFRGFRPNPDVFYQAIDVFVMASENETYGMVTLEALAAGVPVVGAAAGGTAELVQDGHNGLLFPLRDVAACARALHSCLHDQPATRQRVEHARLDQWRYSHHQQCSLTEEIIGGLFPGPPAAADAGNGM